MSKFFNPNNITMNPKEVQTFAEFIVKESFEQPLIRDMFAVKTGVKMKEQIVIASLLGKTGLLKARGTCGRTSSKASAVLSEKFRNPEIIEDLFEQCQGEVDALFKAYNDKINNAKEIFDITGSDEDTFLVLLVVKSMGEAIQRISWLGNKSVAAADATTAGLIAAADVKFYNQIDGFWEQIFDAVTANLTPYVSIPKNNEVTIAAQNSLDKGYTDTLLEAMWDKASPILKSSPESQIYLTNALWENQRRHLKEISQNYTTELTTGGMQFFTWNGKKVINVGTSFGMLLEADFVDNTTNDALYLPHRALFTIPENLQISTLNESDMEDFEFDYQKKEQIFWMAYAFTLDATFVQEDLAVVAY